MIGNLTKAGSEVQFSGQDPERGISSKEAGFRATRKIDVSLFAFVIALCIAQWILFPVGSSAGEGVKTSNEEKRKAVRNSPRPGLNPIGKECSLRISENDRCPVCAMQPIKYPKSSCAIQLKDKRTFYFCATGCMIRTWMHPEVFLAVEKSELEIPVVREYFTGKPMDGRELKWVAGSDIIGPMGPALVPVRGEKELDAFTRRHGGKAVFTLEEMNDELWLKITGKHP